VTLTEATPARSQAGALGLFRAAFKRSRNAMALLDERRRIVDLNGALIGLLEHPRTAFIGHPVYEFVAHGPLATEGEWRAMLVGPDFLGHADLVRADGGTVMVQYAAHPELVTGRRLVLFVVLETSRRGRDLATVRQAQAASSLSRREIEVVGMIADGRTSGEIARDLNVSENTVRTHVRNAMAKLDVRSRAQLVAKVLGEGLALA
jgi:DNA-binding CsgD family transcriptional regulator